ncbi:MAG: substrate-binding domain-containing protein, partial [Pseudomonadota bacterium]
MAETVRQSGAWLIGLAMMAGLSLNACADARTDPVRVVGSSTVFPFAARAAQGYSERTGIRMVVEQTGSGGGHKLFCSGDPSIDATTSSRRQKPSETQLCRRNNVDPVIELKLGYDGIVLARTIDAAPMALDVGELYRALARELPTSDTDCTPRPNPYQRWSQIAPDLPDDRIETYGPPPTSGTRDAFVETAMEAGARTFSCMMDLEARTPNRFRARAHALREDGYWIDAGENDNALIRTLTNTPTALGVFGFSFLDQNTDKVRGIPVGGVQPTAENIRQWTYPVVR